LLSVAFLAGTCAAAQVPAEDAEVREVTAPVAVMQVGIRDGLLSVDVAGASFGDVMRQIASKSGIRVEVAGDVASLPVTTRFRGVELQEGILRLLSLARNRNYFMTYDGQGRLKAVEVRSGETPAAAPKGLGKGPAPAGQNATRAGEVARPPSPRPIVRKNPPASERIIRKHKTEETEEAPFGDDFFEDEGGPGDGPAGDSSEKAPPYIPPPPRQR